MRRGTTALGDGHQRRGREACGRENVAYGWKQTEGDVMIDGCDEGQDCGDTSDGDTLAMF